MEKKQIIVNGGGMVGALAALLLAKQGHTIHFIEKTACHPVQEDDAFDLRVSALSAQSKTLLELADVWQLLPENRLCAYQRLQTWEKGSQKLTFCSQDLGFDALGYIVENRCIQSGLWQELRKLSQVYFYDHSQIVAIDDDDSGVVVTIDNNSQIEADLLVGCDGANSAVRQLLNIGSTAWDYRQHCMLINIKTDATQLDITWQEFRETGPCAFLPLAGDNACLVWYHSAQTIEALKSLSNKQLKQRILETFPALAFDFEVLDKGAFALTRQHAHHYFKGHCVLLGDAAHTINPLAGQGVNLGFKDVQCLVKLLSKSGNLPIPTLLERYQQQRKPANLLMQTAMDLFYKSSKSELSLVRALRKTLLGVAQQSGILKRQVMKYAMGL